jgi:hypothetical protein
MNLLNSEPFEVVFADGHKEPVALRQLTIRQLYTFTEHLHGEQMPALVALCTGKPEEWLDKLELESFGALLKKCLDLNFPKAATIAKSDPVVATKLMPLLFRLQSAERMIQLGGLSTNAPSPAPAVSESAAATGSTSSTSRRRGSSR